MFGWSSSAQNLCIQQYLKLWQYFFLNRQTILSTQKSNLPYTCFQRGVISFAVTACLRTLRDSPTANGDQCYGHVKHPPRSLVHRRSKVDIVLAWPVRSGLSMLGRHLRTQSGNISRYFNTHFPVFSKILWNLYKRPMSQKILVNMLCEFQWLNLFIFAKIFLENEDYSRLVGGFAPPMLLLAEVQNGQYFLQIWDLNHKNWDMSTKYKVKNTHQ